MKTELAILKIIYKLLCDFDFEIMISPRLRAEEQGVQSSNGHFASRT